MDEESEKVLTYKYEISIYLEYRLDKCIPMSALVDQPEKTCISEIIFF